jgi:hypothetical protein
MSKQDDDSIDWRPQPGSEKAWDDTMPNVAQAPPPPLQPTLEEQLTQGGITKMIVPTIMQCSMGGYLVSIPGVGTAAASTIEEIMAFVEQRTLDHFKAKRAEFPKVVREKLTQAKDSIFEKASNARDDKGLIVAVALAGMLIGFTLFGGFHNDGQEGQKRSSGAPEAARPSLSSHRSSGEDTRKQGTVVLPEIHLLKVRPTSDDRPAKRSIQDGLLRPVPDSN